jgi:hypothetical protein
MIMAPAALEPRPQHLIRAQLLAVADVMREPTLQHLSTGPSICDGLASGPAN